MDGSRAEKISTNTGVRPDATAWRRSSRCGAASTCIEVAGSDDRVFIRDSAGDDTVVILTPHTWRELLAWARDGL